MILMGNRGSKKRHDTVALDAIDNSAKTMNWFQDGIDGAAKDRAYDFGIATGDQLKRPADVSEEEGDEFSFPFDEPERPIEIGQRGLGSCSKGFARLATVGERGTTLLAMFDCSGVRC